MVSILEHAIEPKCFRQQGMDVQVDGKSIFGSILCRQVMVASCKGGLQCFFKN